VALLLLALGLCAALVGAPAKAGAAPAVDTWVRPSPPHTAFGEPFFHDPRRGQWVLLESRYRSHARMWLLPDHGSRVWTSVDIEGPSPDPSMDESWAYDWDGDRVLILSGESSNSDTCCSYDRVFLQPWQLTLGDKPTFEPLETTGDRPFSPRYSTTAFDAARKRLLVVSGQDRVTQRETDALYVLDLEPPAHWTDVRPSGLAPLRVQAHAMVDSLGDNLLVWGGTDSLDRFTPEIFALPLANLGAWETWAVTDTLPPLLIRAEDVVLDPEHRRLVAFSGFHRTWLPDSSGAWAYDLDSRVGWTPIPFVGSPPRARAQGTLALDRNHGTLALYGGNGRDEVASNGSRFDFFELPNTPGASWAPVSLSGRIFDLSAGGNVVLDRSRERALVLTGDIYGSELAVQKVGLGTSQDWEFMYRNGPGRPSGRGYASAVFDSASDRLVVYGGKLLGAELGEVWQATFPGPQYIVWDRLFPTGEAPLPRWGAATVYDPVRRRMIVFGGFGGQALDDTWALELAGTPRWTHIIPHGLPPSARYAATAVYDSRRDGMILFGGNATSEDEPYALHDTWFLSFAEGDSWIPLSTKGLIPAGRWYSAGVYDPLRDRMLVLWGRDRSNARPDCLSLDLANGLVWQGYTPDGGGAISRYGHSMVYAPDFDQAIITGGRTYDPYGDGAGPDWYLNFAAPAGGSPPPMSGPPFALLGMSPNPTHAGVDVAFDLPATTTVRARIYDARGRLVRDLPTREYTPGRHVLVWDGVGNDGYKPRPGVYFARLVLGANEVTGKIVLLP